jgi:PTS system nitrogen regulatory IIA component
VTDEDLDLEALAEYLHLDPAQVSRLVERGNLPGRRVSGQWRFSRPEVTFWLERRIGASDDDAELAQVEDAMQRGGDPRVDDLLPVSQLLPVEAMAVPLLARTRISVISSMVELAGSTGWLWDVPRMEEAVRAREDLFPTALDNGVAMMHPRRPLPSIVGQPFIAFGRTERGLPFGASGGGLTDLFFLLCSVNDRGHLHALARLSRLIGDADFLAQLRGVPDARTAHEVLQAREKALLD